MYRISDDQIKTPPCVNWKPICTNDFVCSTTVIKISSNVIQYENHEYEISMNNVNKALMYVNNTQISMVNNLYGGKVLI